MNLSPREIQNTVQCLTIALDDVEASAKHYGNLDAVQVGAAISMLRAKFAQELTRLETVARQEEESKSKTEAKPPEGT